jgi:hypothetical protein
LIKIKKLHRKDEALNYFPAEQVLFQFAFVRNREFMTAFRAAACQHFAAIGSLHALAKTMH